MNMKYVKTIFILMTITLLGYVLAGQFFLPADRLDHRDLCYDYTEDWYRIMPDGSRVKLEVPGKNELDGDVAIETILPDDMGGEISCMCFRAQDFKAYLDGQLIFDYSTEQSRWFGNHSPEACVMIPITAQDGGKTLRIELLSDTGLLYQPYTGSEFGIWMYMVKEYAGELIVAAITFVVAVVTILVRLRDIPMTPTPTATMTPTPTITMTPTPTATVTPVMAVTGRRRFGDRSGRRRTLR